jgi:pyruvate/2-oxoglutarate dehydrogenase complex dihydrolipoamide acyltransferase (E2) component
MARTDRRYTTVPFPKQRQVIVDTLRLGRQKHTIHGLLEVDVTEARQFIQDHKARTGERLSFTAFVAVCLAKAVDGNKQVHAYRNWRNQLVLFDEVDVNTLVEIEIAGRKFPLAHVIRAANRMTYREIHDEIRALQSERRRDRGAPYERLVRLYGVVPGPLRRLVWRVLLKSPHLVKRYIGTVSLTAVGMFGEGGGWGIPIPIYTVGVTLGGIAEKPAVVDGRVEPRELLSVTLSFDHDIVDGAPAARFAQQLKGLIEGGYGLFEGA